MRNTDRKILDKNELEVTETLIHDDSSDDTSNTLIMNATMEFLIAFFFFLLQGISIRYNQVTPFFMFNV